MRWRGFLALLGIALAVSAPAALGQGAWHGVERPALKAKDVDGQARELVRHSERYLELNRPAEAKLAAEDALGLLEKRYGRKDRRLAEPLWAIGNVYFRQARHKDVEPYYLRASAVLEKGADRLAYADSLSRLADLYHNSRRVAEAVPLHRRALPIYEKAFGEEGGACIAPQRPRRLHKALRT